MITRNPHFVLAAVACCATLLLVLPPPVSRGVDGALVAQTVEVGDGEYLGWNMQDSNEDLDAMAQELAKLVASPGFRGFIRSEIAQTKNREGIIELEPFLERASRRRDAPPGLSQYREQTQKAKGRLMGSGFELRGYDLYFPVETHRTKWRGGDDLVVASGPFGDESAVKEIVSYSVRDGRKVLLDAAKAPDTIVLMLAPCEHETHEQQGEKEKVTPQDRLLPKADVTGKEPPEKPVPQSEGNSHVGLHRMYIRDVKESWWRGAPEIYLWFAQRSGNYCSARMVEVNSMGLRGLNEARVWHTSWYISVGAKYCEDRYGHACFSFQSDQPTKMFMRIYESDGGGTRNYVFDLYPGVSCSFIYLSYDDHVDSGVMYRNNFPFQYDYNHDMGNAFVKWHKVH